MIGDDESMAPAARQLAESRWIENVCTEFESSWRSGQRRRIEEVLQTAEPHIRERLLDELLAVELELQFTESGSPEVATYHERFPHDKPRIERLFQSVRADCQEAERRAARLAAIEPLDERDHYELGDEIARGGMGVVFRCHDVELGRHLALKTLLPEYQDHNEAVLRFVNEAKISAQLQHPGVPPVHKLGRLRDGRPYLTMKLVSGRTLAELLIHSDRNPTSETQRRVDLDVFQHVCRTMAYAHSQGIIHRDLKPANIMIGAFDEVQVMDWGLARELDDADESRSSNACLRVDPGPDVGVRSTNAALTDAGRIVGTLSYMPPEQARGERLDCRADVFSLGAILCELLTGKPPHWSELADDPDPCRDAARIAQIVAGKLQAAFQRLNDCGADPELRQLASDCLQANRSLRPANAGEVVERLSHYLDVLDAELREAELTGTRREPRPTETRRRARLARWFAMLLTLVTLGSAITAMSFWNWPLAQVGAANSRRETAANNSGATNSEFPAVSPPTSTPAEHITKSPAVTEFTPFLHQSDAVRSLAYNPQGDRLVSAAATWDKAESQLTSWEVKLWESASGRWIRDFTGHTKAISAVAFSPDGQQLVTASYDHTTKIWDIETGEERLSLEAHVGPVWFAAFSPNGEWIATAEFDGKVILWDAKDGSQKQTLAKHEARVGHVTFSADSTRLASSAFDNTARVWDTATGDELACFVTGQNTHERRSAAFNPDGTRLVTNGDGATCQIWDIATHQPIAKLDNHGGLVFAVAWSPDGRFIATGGANEFVKIWDAGTGAELQTLYGFSDWVHCLAFRPDSQELAWGQGSLLHRWNLATGQRQLGPADSAN